MNTCQNPKCGAKYKSNNKRYCSRECFIKMIPKQKKEVSTTKHNEHLDWKEWWKSKLLDYPKVMGNKKFDEMNKLMGFGDGFTEEIIQIEDYHFIVEKRMKLQRYYDNKGYDLTQLFTNLRA